MTYSPGNAGYPPAQSPGSYGAPGPSYAPAAEPGPSKLPLLLGGGVVLFGLLAYLFSFGPMFTFNVDIGPFGTELSGTGGFGTVVAIIAALLAALLAGVSLLPAATNNYAAIAAVLAVLGALLTIYQIFVKPPGVSIGWGLWTVLGFTILQAIVAVGALLLESGVITAPAPRPKYEQQPQYGQYGPPAGYYGQPQGQPQHAPQHAGPPPGQRPGYPTQYGGYQGPSTGGFGSQAPTGGFGAQSGPPTPPTGYPSFSPPPAVGSGQQQAPAQGSGQHQPQSPAPSPGPSSS